MACFYLCIAMRGICLSNPTCAAPDFQGHTFFKIKYSDCQNMAVTRLNFVKVFNCCAQFEAKCTLKALKKHDAEHPLHGDRQERRIIQSF